MIGWVWVVASAQGADLGEYIGRFEAPAEVVEQAVGQAVEDGAAQFSALFRGIARRRLQESIHGSPWLTIAAAGEQVTIASARRPEGLATRLDGAPVPLKTDDGKPATVRRWLADGQLRSEACDEEGACVAHTFALTGDTLVVTRTTRSPQLPSPISFEIRYRRASSTD